MTSGTPELSQKATKRVLLTGASGTLGFNIARLLASETHDEIILPVRRLLPCFTAFGTRVELVQMQLCESEAFDRLLDRSRPDVIVNCATCGLRAPKPSWTEVIDFNVGTTLRLFESYCNTTASQFIHISTGMVYRSQERPIRETDPVGTLQPYAATKAAADFLLQSAAAASGRRLTIVRPFGLTGLQDFMPRLFPGLIHAAAAGEPFPMTAGEQIRDFCAAEDVAEAVRLCIASLPEDQIRIINLGGGMPMSVRQWVEMICSDLRLQVRVQFGIKTYPAHDPMHLAADNRKARQLLGWYPKTRFSYAVWELAQEMAPGLLLHRPERYLCQTTVNSR